MAGIFENNYKGLAIGSLLAAQSGLQGDLAKLQASNLLTSANAQALVRHVLYFNTSPIDAQGNFNPQTPTNPDPGIEEAVGLVNFDNLVNNTPALLTAGTAIHGIVAGLLTYTGGSCPPSAEQPAYFTAMGNYGASLDT